MQTSLAHYSYTTHRFPSLFFITPPTTEIYTLSLHDALPISWSDPRRGCPGAGEGDVPVAAEPLEVRLAGELPLPAPGTDRKSTRLNSSHLGISYAVFCLKKKK